MAQAGGGHSDEFGEIITRVMEGLSLEGAAIRLKHTLSGMTISRMMKGKVPLESTVRAFAVGFADRLCELYGQVIALRFGVCDHTTATNWLLEKAGHFKPPPEAAPGELPMSAGALEALLARAVEAGARAVLADREQEHPEDTYDLAYAREMRRVREKLKAEGILKLPDEMGHEGGTRKLTAADAIAEAEEFEQMVRELYGKASE